MVVQVVSEIVGDYLDKGREEELVEEKVLLKRSQVGWGIFVSVV